VKPLSTADEGKASDLPDHQRWWHINHRSCQQYCKKITGSGIHTFPMYSQKWSSKHNNDRTSRAGCNHLSALWEVCLVHLIIPP